MQVVSKSLPPLLIVGLAAIATVLFSKEAYAAEKFGEEIIIQKKIDALPKEGGTVKLEAKTYVVRDTIVLPSNVTIKGAGRNKTIIRLANGAASEKLKGREPKRIFQNEKFSERKHPEGNHDITIKDLTIDGNAENNRYVGEGIALANNYNYHIENVHVMNCRGFAGIITWPNHKAAREGKVYKNYILNCIVERNQPAYDRDQAYGHGIYVTAFDNENVLIKGCITRNNSASGIFLEDYVSYIFVENNESYGNQGNGIWLCEVSNSVIRYNKIHNNKGDGMHISQGKGNLNNLIYSNQIANNGRFGAVLIRQYNPGRSNTIILGNYITNSGDKGLVIDDTASGNVVAHNFIFNGILIESKGNILINNYVRGEKKVAEGNRLVPWDYEKPWTPENLIGGF